MSQKINPREVLSYLNDLGYTNINAQQLKDFITDLKKLIKYENKHKQKENIEPVTPANWCCPDFCHCSYVDPRIDRLLNCAKRHSQSESNHDDIFSHLHSQHTVASRAKEVPTKGKQISVHIRKPKQKTDAHEHCTHVTKLVDEGGLQLIQNVETTSDGSKLYINTESTIKTIDPGSKQSLPTKPESTKKKSKCSVIRCGSVKSINKCDPVALYHYYQQQWKKQKFPGQETHSDLRWAVREKLLSAPRVDIKSSSMTCRKRCNSWKG